MHVSRVRIQLMSQVQQTASDSIPPAPVRRYVHLSRKVRTMSRIYITVLESTNSMSSSPIVAMMRVPSVCLRLAVARAQEKLAKLLGMYDVVS
jgi:hypothetical protein